jgi:hypothetical protein
MPAGSMHWLYLPYNHIYRIFIRTWEFYDCYSATQSPAQANNGNIDELTGDAKIYILLPACLSQLPTYIVEQGGLSKRSRIRSAMNCLAAAFMLPACHTSPHTY